MPFKRVRYFHKTDANLCNIFSLDYISTIKAIALSVESCTLKENKKQKITYIMYTELFVSRKEITIRQDF